MKEVYQFVDENADLFLNEFKEFIRIPSVSTENIGIDETVKWLISRMKENGVEDVRVFETQRHPIILGKVGKTAKRTLLVWGKYDVVPPGDRADWKADPYAAEVVDGRIIGRGTYDAKSGLMASVHAVKAFLECKKSLPINLIFLFEGEEEIGSPSLKSFIEQHKDELSVCDSILLAAGGENKAGEANLVCGHKGRLYIELSVKSPTGVEVHSMYAGVTINPAWRLVSALQSLKQDEKVLIPHFYDGVKEPDLKEKIKYGLARIAVSKEKLEEAFEVKTKKDMNVSDLLLEAFYKPTLNIDGLFSGYTVKGGIKAIVPDSALAKIDIRLVPDQDSSVIFENLRRHLDSKGFSDINVERLGADMPTYRVDPEEKIVKVVKDALKNVVSKKIMIVPINPGSASTAWLPVILGKPMAAAGSGPAYMAHRPNEFITSEQYLKGIKLYATIYEDYAS